MAKEINIRKASPADAEALGRLSEEFAAHQSKPFDESRRDSHVCNVIAACDDNDNHMLMVAETGEGQVVGYISAHFVPFFLLQGTEAYVSELMVTASARDHGIGSRLLDHVEKEAQKRGCARMMVNNVRETEAYQRSFYAKRGFTERVGVGNFVKDLTK